MRTDTYYFSMDLTEDFLESRNLLESVISSLKNANDEMTVKLRVRLDSCSRTYSAEGFITGLDVIPSLFHRKRKNPIETYSYYYHPKNVIYLIDCRDMYASFLIA